MAESTRRRPAPRGKAAGSKALATGAKNAPARRHRAVAGTVAEVPTPRSSNSSRGWIEMLNALVQAPVGMGRGQAARLQATAEGLDRFIENRIEVVLNRVNIPSRSDIERLNR
ncbi:MAG: hypothetical protein ABR573_08135, partial [Candidatus Dormibacteria bacterium]